MCAGGERVRQSRPGLELPACLDTGKGPDRTLGSDLNFRGGVACEQTPSVGSPTLTRTVSTFFAVAESPSRRVAQW